MPKITSQTKTIQECTFSEMRQCYGLLLREFDGVIWKDFTRDFKEKDHVMMLINEQGLIVGFSTLMIIDLNVSGRTTKAIFSGDTAVLNEYRDSFGFATELAKYFTRSIEMYPENDVYYVLITKGWRTYRVLPFYFKEFAPSYRQPTSKEQSAVIDVFGYKKYPKNYDSRSGLLVFGGEVQRLKAESTDALPPAKNSPDADFFFSRNPDYLSGNELICVAKVALENFTGAMQRLRGPDRKEAVCKN